MSTDSEALPISLAEVNENILEGASAQTDDLSTPSLNQEDIVAPKEEIDGEEPAPEQTSSSIAKASETSAATTSGKTLLDSCGDTSSSIRSILCSAPEAMTAGEISDDVDDGQKAFLGIFAKKEEQEEEDDITLDEITADSDISNPNRRIWVVTTACLPWRTGTAVNPLLRALYLTRGRPQGYVTLVVPWLKDSAAREKLYGAENSFSCQQEQEEWVRNFCRTRAKCEEEEKNLRILFYDAVYQKSFGSIFPSVDICSLIPDSEADVAILEEPEHLNWFRVPSVLPANTPGMELGEEKKARDGDDGTQEETIANEVKREKAELGWAHKFRFVVGILHTNYSAYMNQYAIGTSIIAAPAIGMLSSIVVRAYCHRVIRLSAVLPSLAPSKEVTCNVHGVRSEFLEVVENDEVVDDDEGSDEAESPPASVYFIGKVMWAKGFDHVLEIEDQFKWETGSYFSIDIYGAGPDEKAIKRAFFGRNAFSKKTLATEASETVMTESDLNAAAVFAAQESLRKQVEPVEVETYIPSIEVVRDYSSPTGSSVQISESRSEEAFEAGGDAVEGGDSASEEYKRALEEDQDNSPLSIIGDLGSNTIATGLATSQAVYSLTDAIVKAGLKMTFAQSKEENGKSGSDKDKNVKPSRFNFDPPQTTYEWRRNPIPARFLGVKDHAQLRDISAYKIFLNASDTEVLCTTTAEALAMGKFAIIPRHPSNEFFYQFPNCLPYASVKECVEKLQWALGETPVPLSDEDRHKFTWEGATERLFEYAGITKREMKERERSGMNKTDSRIAWFHSESGRTGQLIGKFFSRQNSAVSEPKSEDVEAIE